VSRTTVDLLAIAAHPDDVEQTCGGAMIRMAEAGYRTGIVDLTAGDMGTRGTPQVRIAESEEAARRMHRIADSRVAAACGHPAVLGSAASGSL
jgi:LmbE family N-acetylglucosaminyl deacetylase